MYDTTFINALASKEPTPGGGGASAYIGALAAALSSMVGNLTIGKKKYTDVEAEVYLSLERLDRISERLVELIDEDAEAFEPLAKSYGMPKSTPEEIAKKDAAMQDALIDACEVPLEIMRQCAKVVEETEFLAFHGSRLALSDAGAAVVFANAALNGASLNIYINVSSMADKVRAANYVKEVESLTSFSASLTKRIYDYVVEEIK